MKKIIIIGGGIAGLSAGIYAQKAGFESVIYEKQIISGGECTGWNRRGFHIDGCIHWLMGTKNGTGMNGLWNEVGALGNVEIYQPENFVTVEYDGTTVILHRDLEKLKTHLIEISPEDTDEIEKLCGYIKAFYGFEPPSEKPLDIMNMFEMMKYGISMKDIGSLINKLKKLTICEYASSFKNPAIRAALLSVAPPDFSAFILPSSIGAFISGNGGRPAGGSLAMVQRMEQKYKSLGGKIKLGSEVEHIIVENGTAEGIIFADNTDAYADYIIPACDIDITFRKLLSSKYRDENFVDRYMDDKTYPLHSCVYASFAVNADLSDYPKDLLFQTEPFDFEDRETDMLSIKHYSYEPSFAPKGKSILIAYFDADYSWWSDKHNNPDEYEEAKEKLVKSIINGIEIRFPELKEKIKILDVATPVTYERYCGAYKGAWMSFGATPNSKQLIHNGKIKGIKNLFMAGQWLMPPGGLPAAALTGKWAVQRICKNERIKIQ